MYEKEFHTIQEGLELLAQCVMNSNCVSPEGRMPSMQFEYTDRDYANLFTVFYGILSVGYTKKMAMLCCENGVDVEEYSNSPDFKKSITVVNDVFEYYTGKKVDELIASGYNMPT